MGGYTQIDFTEDLQETMTAYAALNAAEVDAVIAREARNQVEAVIYAMIKNYRLALPTFFPADSPLVTSLPRLTPRRGHTPDPVQAEGSWNPATGQADLTWSPSDESTIVRYEIRMTPGEKYATKDESTLGRVDPDAPLQFATNQGLTREGRPASFKVYVILKTGNERAATPS